MSFYKHYLMTFVLLLGTILLMDHMYTKELERHYLETKNIIALYCWPFIPTRQPEHK